MTTAIIVGIIIGVIAAFILGVVVGNKFTSYVAENMVRAYFYRQGMHAGAVEDHTNLILNKDAFEDMLATRPLSQWGKWHEEQLRLHKEVKDG